MEVSIAVKMSLAQRSLVIHVTILATVMKSVMKGFTYACTVSSDSICTASFGFSWFFTFSSFISFLLIK